MDKHASLGHRKILGDNKSSMDWKRAKKCVLSSYNKNFIIERTGEYFPPLQFTCRNCGGGDRGRVAIYRPFGEVSLSLNRTVTCMVLKANDRRTSCPCHDEFRGPRSDYVRQEIAGTSNDNTTTNDPSTNTPKTYLPPPIMLKASEKTREYMKVITTAFPNIRSKLSGELIKLYTNTSIDYHKLLNLLDQHHFQYHVITPKDERPIKVVIKGLPCNTDINDIKSDLTDQGFTDTKVSQLIGRITNKNSPSS
ncbi:uncharacterized protein TNCV_341051 [Trichonephila clavipes]|uniref:Pre-C2HC domain-containing protein n=1 Tax=Trichonephila clavipes TaxID=2585209 RepID=A0A8X6SXA3_TRICX|nr:uncharacterized protein TNCV_341051 [Trichonephila clavipes]